MRFIKYSILALGIGSFIWFAWLLFFVYQSSKLTEGATITGTGIFQIIVIYGFVPKFLVSIMIGFCLSFVILLYQQRWLNWFTGIVCIGILGSIILTFIIWLTHPSLPPPRFIRFFNHTGCLDENARLKIARSKEFNPVPLIEKFRDAMRAGDIHKASTIIVSGRRDRMRTVFESFTPEYRANINKYLTTDLLLRSDLGDYKEYAMRRQEAVGMVEYPIIFAIDCDGEWRIANF